MPGDTCVLSRASGPVLSCPHVPKKNMVLGQHVKDDYTRIL